MAIGACFPLQSSASQDLSLFGGHPVDMTAYSTRGWPVFSSDPCLTEAAAGFGLTLQETHHIFVRPHQHPGPG